MKDCDPFWTFHLGRLFSKTLMCMALKYFSWAPVFCVSAPFCVIKNPLPRKNERDFPFFAPQNKNWFHFYAWNFERRSWVNQHCPTRLFSHATLYFAVSFHNIFLFSISKLFVLKIIFTFVQSRAQSRIFLFVRGGYSSNIWNSLWPVFSYYSQNLPL